MRARIGAIRDAVAVDIEVTAEGLAAVEIGRGHHLAAIHLPVRVPGQRLAQPLIHADIEIEHDEDRRLQPVGEVERLRRHLEAFLGIFGKEQHVLGVAMRGIGRGQDIRLLRARRHARRRPAALHVEDHRRDLGEIGKADEFRHQRNAGARRAGEGARAVPRGTDDDADRGQLVFRLDDREFVLAGFLVDAQPPAMAHERLGHRGRRRDRIPRGNRGTAIDGTQPRRVVAIDEDLVADLVELGDPQPAGIGQMLERRSRGPYAGPRTFGAISLSLPLNCSPISVSITFGSMSRMAERAPR